MKVNALTSQRSSTSTTTITHPSHDRVSGTDTSFSSELADQQSGMTREELEALLRKIDEQGARLTNTPTYDELKSYRGLVKEFVGEVVSQIYSLNSNAGWDRLGRQKVYTTVRKIDEELEAMAEHIRLGQADSLSIVASQDAIRGMLVDLYS